jgi:hypothetical protein
LSGRSEFATPNADAINGASTVTSAAPTVMAGLVQGSSGHPRSSTFPRIDSYRPESRCVCCRRNLLRPSGDFACEGKISLAKRLISLAKRFCFARRPRKILKSFGQENFPFRGFVRFEGFTTYFSSRFLFAVRIPIRPSCLA